MATPRRTAAAELARPDLAEVLRTAFRGEVRRRLPQLLAAATGLRDAPDLAAAREVRRHVHSLASSAVIVGEVAVSTRARECESLLAAALDRYDLAAKCHLAPPGGEVAGAELAGGEQVARRVATLVDEIAELLAGHLPASP